MTRHPRSGPHDPPGWHARSREFVSGAGDRMDLIHSDPLATPVPLPAMVTDDAAVDVNELVIGRTETGKP